MGSDLSSPQDTDFCSRVRFISSLDDPNFGKITIYRFKEPPFDYVMRLTRAFPDLMTDSSKCTKLLEDIQRRSHRCVAKIHHVQYI